MREMGKVGKLASSLRRIAARALGREDPVVLMYHRVADPSLDPWDLAVHPTRFAEQMDVLRRVRVPVPLDWLVGEIVAGRKPRRAVAVTFDDGYLDVLRDGKPVLERFGIPATMFLTTGSLGSPSGFWWDRLATAVLLPATMPDVVRLSFASITSRDRVALHRELWNRIRVLGPVERDLAVEEVARVVGPVDLPSAPIMTRAEVRELAAGGVVTIGAHSVSHPSLPSLSDEAQRYEMEESRRAVEEITAGAVRRFAYPFGDFDARSERIAREVGFEFAMSTRPGSAVSKDDLFRLPRYAVSDWSGERFEAELRWLV
jgi:peptidoglycan/xylan/chitin deacetylase (PgdA/CDA1 family)